MTFYLIILKDISNEYMSVLNRFQGSNENIFLTIFHASEYMWTFVLIRSNSDVTSFIMLTDVFTCSVTFSSIHPLHTAALSTLVIMWTSQIYVHLGHLSCKIVYCIRTDMCLISLPIYPVPTYTVFHRR